LFALPREYAAAYVRAFADDEGTVQDNHLTLVSANRKLLQDVYELIQTKFPELGEYIRISGQSPRCSLRFRTGSFAPYSTLIGFDHPKKHHALARILARQARGWTNRKAGTTRRMILEALQSGAMTSKEVAESLGVTVATSSRHLKHLNGLKFVRVDEKGTETSWSALFTLTDRGQRFLQLPSLGLLGGIRRKYGRTKVKILQTLTGAESMTIHQIVAKLGISRYVIYGHLHGVLWRGARRQGLAGLGLVHRVRTDHHDTDIYSLTDAGKRFLDELATLFPNL